MKPGDDLGALIAAALQETPLQTRTCWWSPRRSSQRLKAGLIDLAAVTSDDRVRTKLRTQEGWLEFQDYFVRRQSKPVISAIAFEGADDAKPHPAFLDALASERLEAVIVCPSNPFISVEPILALPGVRTALTACAAPVIAVSPVIGGKAVKGPTAKMMAELGFETSAVTVAERYADFLDAYVLDEQDAALAARLNIPSVATKTLMTDLDDRVALARTALEFARSLTRPARARRAAP